MGHYPNAICSWFRVCFVILLYKQVAQSLKKIMPEANVPKVGHGPKMGQNEFDCACVSMLFTCIPLVFHSPYLKGTWMYWPASGPVLLLSQ